MLHDICVNFLVNVARSQTLTLSHKVVGDGWWGLQILEEDFAIAVIGDTSVDHFGYFLCNRM